MRNQGEGERRRGAVSLRQWVPGVLWSERRVGELGVAVVRGWPHRPTRSVRLQEVMAPARWEEEGSGVPHRVGGDGGDTWLPQRKTPGAWGAAGKVVSPEGPPGSPVRGAPAERGAVHLAVREVQGSVNSREGVEGAFREQLEEGAGSPQRRGKGLRRGWQGAGRGRPGTEGASGTGGSESETRPPRTCLCRTCSRAVARGLACTSPTCPALLSSLGV